MKTAVIAITLLTGTLNATVLPPYTVIACNGAGQVACSVSSVSHTTTPGEMGLLTNQVFNNWLTANFGNTWTSLGPNPTFSFSWVKGNNNGYIIGNYFSRGFASGFVYRRGELSCCTTDSPFGLNDINSQNLVAGYMPGTGGFIGDEYGRPLPLTFTGGFQMNAFADTFLAIDDQDRILMRDTLQRQDFMLIPAGVPEPASIVLLGIVVLGCGAIGRRIARATRKTRQQMPGTDRPIADR
jgi:hypothetical protein